MSQDPDFKEKISLFLASLKEKLPFGKNDEDEEEEEEYEDSDGKTAVVDVTSMMDQLKSEKTKPDIQGDEVDEEDNDDDDDEDEGKGNLLNKIKDDWQDPAKKKQLIVRGVIILFLVYLGIDAVLNPEEKKEATKVVKKTPKRRKRRKRPVKRRQKRRKKEVAKKELEQMPSEKEQKQPINIAKEAPSIEKSEPPKKKEMTPPPEDMFSPPPKAKEEAAKKVVDIPPETPIEPVAKKQDAMNEGEKVDEMTLGLDDETSPPKKEENLDLTSKIISEEKVDYIAPPNYQKVGRGLVYNCIERHWACVSKFSYFQCRENMNWNKKEKKPYECFVKNVYATSEDCRIVQLHYINTNFPTDFCNDNKEKRSGKKKTSELEIPLE